MSFKPLQLQSFEKTEQTTESTSSEPEIEIDEDMTKIDCYQATWKGEKDVFIDCRDKSIYLDDKNKKYCPTIFPSDEQVIGSILFGGKVNISDVGKQLLEIYYDGTRDEYEEERKQQIQKCEKC